MHNNSTEFSSLKKQTRPIAELRQLESEKCFAMFGKPPESRTLAAQARHPFRCSNARACRRACRSSGAGALQPRTPRETADSDRPVQDTLEGSRTFSERRAQYCASSVLEGRSNALASNRRQDRLSTPISTITYDYILVRDKAVEVIYNLPGPISFERNFEKI